MEQFIVSARKYRPAQFSTVVGQDSITKTLQNAIKTNQVAQAFLFCGPRGVGKTTCARILAKALNCPHLSEEGEPCNVCDSCKSFDHSASMNIYELDAASNNSVDKMRELVDQVRIPPQGGKYKVYIIDEVHMLSSSAFNAFLKTLEEPPPYAKFILATTEKHKIIPTILSRCQIFDFRRITIEDIALHLKFVAESEGVIAEDEALNMIAQKADGGLRDALSLFDQMVSFSGKNLTYIDVIANLNILDYDYFFRIVDFIVENNIKDSMLLLNEIINRGFDPQHFILGLSAHIRNLIMAQNEETVKLIDVSDVIRKKYANQARITTSQLFIKMLDFANKCDTQYRESNHKRLSVELAVMCMGQLFNKSNLMGRSDTMERQGSHNEATQAVRPIVEKIPPVLKTEEKSPEKVEKQNSVPSISETRPTGMSGGIKGGMLSIKAVKENIQTNSADVKKAISGDSSTKICENLLKDNWERVVSESIIESPFLSMIKQAKLDYNAEKKLLSVTLNNTFAQQATIQFSHTILNNLRSIVENLDFQMEVLCVFDETESSEDKMLYTDSQKFQFLMDENPNVLMLKRNLGLDVQS